MKCKIKKISRLGLIALIVGTFLGSSCSSQQDRSRLSSDDKPGSGDLSGEIDDDTLVTPSPVSGSFIDFDCDGGDASILCIVRQKGYSVELPIDAIFKGDLPKLEAYFTSDVNDDLDDLSDSVVHTATLEKNSASMWGVNLDIQSKDSVMGLAGFLIRHGNNADAGLVITISSDDYKVSDGQLRKSASLSKCLLGHYINSWLSPAINDKDVTSLPVDVLDVLEAPMIRDIILGQDCAERNVKDSQAKFNGQMAAMMEDYLSTLGFTKEDFDKLAEEIK